MKEITFNDLYEYVKCDILKYTDKKVPKYMIMRLKGLADGKFMANKKTKPMAHYTNEQILMTFRVCKGDILSHIERNTSFKDEKHMFNYIMVIIESNINDVVNRMENAKKSEEKSKNMELTHQTHESAKYTTKSTKKKNDRLKELW